MLGKYHIDYYRENIMAACRTASADIELARRVAKEVDCSGCDFCKYLRRHEALVGKITADLILIVESLVPGMRASQSFAKTFTGDITLYRGFIDAEGRYKGLWRNQMHDTVWEEYAKENGKEKAYKLIKVSGSYGINKKAKVIFSDRKDLPTASQLATLRDLMIDAEGDLAFCFYYDPTHPHPT